MVEGWREHKNRHRNIGGERGGEGGGAKCGSEMMESQKTGLKLLFVIESAILKIYSVVSCC